MVFIGWFIKSGKKWVINMILTVCITQFSFELKVK